MVRKGLAINEDVVKINHNKFANERSQNVVHKTHKS
jgi:hypothetical protein